MTKRISDSLVELIELNIRDKYISKTRCDVTGLFILNYTHKCQFEHKWDIATVMCRGLVVDENYTKFTNPIPKFFNIEQHRDDEIPRESFKVNEKLDGSLILSFYKDGETFLCTRGSFTSDQAKLATEIWKSKYSGVKLDQNCTYMWELIHPDNRIVVDYGEKKDIVLLAVRDIETGYEVDIDNFKDDFEVARSYDFKDFRTIKQLNTKNEEGFVIKFDDSGFRVKVKFEEYVRLHRIVTNVSSKNIHESLMKGDSLDELIENVSDEFFDFVVKTRDELLGKFNAIKTECVDLANFYKTLINNGTATRKSAAESVKTKHPEICHMIFKLIDDKSADEQIWKSIKPEYQRPFRIDADS